MSLQGRDINEHLPSSYRANQSNSGYMQHREWSPYENNGGNVCAIAAEGKIIMASDSR